MLSLSPHLSQFLKALRIFPACLYSILTDFAIKLLPYIFLLWLLQTGALWCHRRAGSHSGGWTGWLRSPKHPQVSHRVLFSPPQGPWSVECPPGLQHRQHVSIHLNTYKRAVADTRCEQLSTRELINQNKVITWMIQNSWLTLWSDTDWELCPTHKIRNCIHDQSLWYKINLALKSFSSSSQNKWKYIISYKVCAIITCFYCIWFLLPRSFCMHAPKPLASSAGTQEMSMW